MIINTFTNTMVKKFIGKDLVHRLVIYPIKCPYYKGGETNESLANNYETQSSQTSILREPA